VKATVSLPGPLLEAADELAKRLGMSRSEFFAAAVEAYLEDHRQAGVTERLNEIYHDEESSLDPVMAEIQSASLARDDSEREQELLAMFNGAGAEVTEEDLAERESLLGGFAAESEEPESAPAEARSFLSVARSLELEGPPDWSVRLKNPPAG